MSAQHVGDHDFSRRVLQNERPVLIDFWAPWCGPCRAMGPVVDELANELDGEAVVVKVNVDEAPETAQRYGIQAIPTFAVVSQGQVQERFSGVVEKERLRGAIQRFAQTSSSE